MTLDSIIAVLNALSSYAGRVVVASNTAAAVEAVKPFVAMPACVLFGMTEKASPNELVTGGPRHRVTVTLKLLTAAREVSDPHGKAAYAQANTARAELLPALLGLIPDTNFAPMEYSTGNIVYAEAGLLLWLDEFTTAYYLFPNRG